MQAARSSYKIKLNLKKASLYNKIHVNCHPWRRAMETKDKILQKFNKAKKNILLRCEFNELGNRTQVAGALKHLVDCGYVDRVGKGIYERKNPANTNATNEYVMMLVSSIFKELGKPLSKVEIEKRNNVRVIIAYTEDIRMSRKLIIHGFPVFYNHGKLKKKIPQSNDWEIPTNVDKLPKSDVCNYIKRLAEHYNIIHQRTGLDEFAEAVTRMAGDEIKLDPTEKLLVALKKKELINAKQLSRLLSNYLKEESNVRSVRRFRDSRLSAEH
jgi:hypothetical protein